jgi:hypothetical protein
MIPRVPASPLRSPWGLVALTACEEVAAAAPVLAAPLTLAAALAGRRNRRAFQGGDLVVAGEGGSHGAGGITYPDPLDDASVAHHLGGRITAPRGTAPSTAATAAAREDGAVVPVF